MRNTKSQSSPRETNESGVGVLVAGLRVGEVVALRPEHVDMRTGKVIIREGKGAKDRKVWIDCDYLRQAHAFALTNQQRLLEAQTEHRTAETTNRDVRLEIGR